MERALDPERLATALGEHDDLPTVDELTRAIGEAELNVLLTRGDVSEDLHRTAWYLHGIASVRPSLELYGVERQRAAFEVSAHIFDLVLQREEMTLADRLEHGFAAQVAYWRSQLDPNATAIYVREFASRQTLPSLESNPELVALSLGTALLGVDANYLFPALRKLRGDIARLSEAFDTSDLLGTPYEAIASVVAGVRHLLVFAIYGEIERLGLARTALLSAIRSEAAHFDYASRWVAAHLLKYADGLESTSIWTALPPDTPPGVIRSFAFAPSRSLPHASPRYGLPNLTY